MDRRNRVGIYSRSFTTVLIYRRVEKLNYTNKSVYKFLEDYSLFIPMVNRRWLNYQSIFLQQHPEINKKIWFSIFIRSILVPL